MSQVYITTYLPAFLPLFVSFLLFIFTPTSNFRRLRSYNISHEAPGKSRLDLLFLCNQIHIKLYRFPPKHLSHYQATRRSTLTHAAGVPDLEDLKLHFAPGCSWAEIKRQGERQRAIKSKFIFTSAFSQRVPLVHSAVWGILLQIN